MSSRATWWWPTTTASSSCRRNWRSRPRAKAQKRHDDEDGKRKQLAAGELSLDMYKMREGLAKAGLVYVDKPEDVIGGTGNGSLNAKHANPTLV